MHASLVLITNDFFCLGNHYRFSGETKTKHELNSYLTLTYTLAFQRFLFEEERN